ncbi:MAG TPA: VOC family protein [Thermoanaerobaculia bacterium]|nr:VOC family protein [Thermoanaerobaculia bacterium]
MVNSYPFPTCPTLVARNLAASTLWYMEGLGFRLIFSTADGCDEPLFSHLRWAESSDLVLTAEDPQVALAGARGLGVTLRFAVPGSVDELAAKARAYGIEILSGPVDRLWKAREMVVADPDGYHLAFIGRMLGELPVEAEAEAELLVEKAVVTAV